MSFLSRLAKGAKLAAVPLALGTLAACASPFRADVSRFQTQLPAPQGQSFAVVAEDPSLAGGLEFSMYANQLAEQMQQLGYARAATPENASLLVRFDYGVDNGRERVVSTPDPFFSPWYGYRGSFYGGRGFGGPWGYGWNPGYFGGGAWGGGRNVNSYTVYTSGIEVKIDRAVDGQRLFEGNAQAVSTSNRLQYLVPNLVEAMFTDFPGNSGETVRISIAPEEQPVRRTDR